MKSIKNQNKIQKLAFMIILFVSIVEVEARASWLVSLNLQFARHIFECVVLMNTHTK